MLIFSSLILLLVLLVLSVPVAAAMGVLGLLIDQLFSPFPLFRAMGEVTWSTSTNFTLVAIPLYVLLGEILVRSGIAEKVYSSLNSWLYWIPGGLMHVNVVTAGMFSAIAGSSIATAATVGTVALPQARRFGYREGLFAGSIAAGGTLGILIPPSINLIVYGFLTSTSIPRLFLAGILPGLMMVGLFMLFILIASLVRGESSSPRREVFTWRDRFRGLVHLLPVVALFAVVVGSIYAGLATPTEAASLGVIVAVALAAAYGRLTLAVLSKALLGTMSISAMIMLILLGAYFLNFAIASSGLIQQITSFVEGTGFSTWQMFTAIVLMYVLLGFFIETLSLMVITIPIVAPVVFALGFDPVWFGIVMIMLIEMALITPPVGMNLYVVQGVRGRGRLSEVIAGSVPFVLLLALGIVLVIAFPQLALALPAGF